MDCVLKHVIDVKKIVSNCEWLLHCTDSSFTATDSEFLWINEIKMEDAEI